MIHHAHKRLRLAVALLSSAAGIIVMLSAAGPVPAAAPDDVEVPETVLPGSITPDYPPAGEEPLIEGRPLNEILNSQGYIERLVTHLIGYETWIGLCADAEPVARQRTWMLSEPVALPGAEEAALPQWLEIVDVEGCGKTYQRMVYAAYDGGKPVFHVQLPGDTRTEPVLQQSVIEELRARESAAAWAEGCERSDHARVLAGEVDEVWAAVPAGAWREIWVVHTCTGIKHVPLIFTPDADGQISFQLDAG